MRAADVFFMVLVLLATGCGSSNPAGPAAAGSSESLRIAGGPVIDLTAGETRTLPIEMRGPSGAFVPAPAATYTWTSSDPAIVRVTGPGAIAAGPGLGQALVTATSPGGESASARLWVQLPESVPSAYRITLLYDDAVPESWKPDFEWAAERWQQVIRAELPPAALTNPPVSVCPQTDGSPPIPPLTGVTTGTTILVQRSTLPHVVSTGGPCTHRPWPSPTVIFGRVTIANTSGILGNPRYVALHEIGHALGLVGLIQGVQPPWLDPATQRYSGPLALEGHRRQFGTAPEFLVTRAGHWPFPHDVMSLFSIRVTKVSVGALMDMGYPAAWYGADPW